MSKLPASPMIDPDDIVHVWYNIFNNIVDQHAPMRQKRVKRKSQPDWFN